MDSSNAVPMIEPTVVHHGHPYYFNGGELFYNLLVNAFTFTLALVFSSAIVLTIRMCADGNNVAAAWIAFFIILIIAIILIIILAHSKKHMMRFAYHFA